ncbi:coiled-coil domain-containing protein 81-like isoform 1-T3 [Amazona ochrocephala]
MSSRAALLGGGNRGKRPQHLLPNAIPVIPSPSGHWERAGSQSKAMEPPPAEHPSPFGPSLPLQGIRIHTLGSFDVVSARIQVGNSTVPIWKPVFRVARNLGLVHNLLEGQDLRGDKELKPLSYSKVATDARVSRCQAKRCILGTTSLLSRCLGNGHNVALVLRDVGVLLMEEGVVRMRFYPTFLHGIVGKRIPRGDAAESLRLLGLVVSPMVPIASLTSTGNVIVFPEFEQGVGSKRPPRTPLRSLSPPHPLGCIPSVDKKEEFPPHRRDMEGKAAPSSCPQRG